MATARPALFVIAAPCLGAMLQGFALVSFPASSTVLRSMHGLSDAQYGLIFLPQVGATIAGALLGGGLSQRLGLKRLLWIALLFDLLSQAGLAGVRWAPHAGALPLLLASTGAMGFGFGLMGSPMNAYPALFFAQQRSTATTIMHALNGSGLMLGPLLLQLLSATLGWVAFPLCLAAVALLLALYTALVPLPQDGGATSAGAPPERSPIGSRVFWTLAAIAVVYAFAEGSFSNWAVVYLQDGKHLPAAGAAEALAAFWGALVGGRLLLSLVVLKLPVTWVWRSLPLLMAAALLLLPQADTPLRSIGLFALAGFGCSAFYPLTVSMATGRFPQHLAWVAAMMIAALNVGTGLGSYVLGVLHAHLPFEQLYRYSTVYPLLALLLSFTLPRPGKSHPAP